MKESLVSIITPAYNAEKYLAECIESVLAQTYQNWEYIIVNNCSTDRSLEIAQAYAQRDRRVRVHNNVQFLNQIQNWNHALRQASAEAKYCKVVHADDWLFPECLTRMVELAEANPSVGLVSAYRLDENWVNLDGLPYPITVISGVEVCRASLLNKLYLFGSPSSLLIRADLIRGREKFYNEANIHADKEACFDILQHTDFGFVHQVLTYTRRHNEATTMTITRRFNTLKPARLMILKKYGPVYLSPEEYDRCFKQQLSSYYRFLAQKVFEFKGEDFWKYHQHELEKLGCPLSFIRLMKVSLLELLNFRETVKRIKQARQEQIEKSEKGTDLKSFDVVVSKL